MKTIGEIYEKLKQIETDDYQNRNGEWLKSNIPDSIRVFKQEYKIEVVATFKNTDEDTCKKWLKRKLSEYNIEKIEAWQDGDYHDDWVEAYAVVTV